MDVIEVGNSGKLKKKRKSRPGKRDRELLKAVKEEAPKEANPEFEKTEQWQFEVDYNDHFETPKLAYEHVLPWLQMQANCLGKSLDELIVYDPYFCQGKMVNFLKSLGIMQVINKNVDFYYIKLTKHGRSGAAREPSMRFVETGRPSRTKVLAFTI